MVFHRRKILVGIKLRKNILSYMEGCQFFIIFFTTRYTKKTQSSLCFFILLGKIASFSSFLNGLLYRINLSNNTKAVAPELYKLYRIKLFYPFYWFAFGLGYCREVEEYSNNIPVIWVFPDQINILSVYFLEVCWGGAINWISIYCPFWTSCQSLACVWILPFIWQIC